MSLFQDFIAFDFCIRIEVHAEYRGMIYRNVSNECPEADFVISRHLVDCRNNTSKFAECFFSDPMIAERDIKINIASGIDMASPSFFLIFSSETLQGL